MLRIRRFVPQDAEQISNVIRRALLEVNSRDYPQSVITRLYEHFTPERICEISKTREIYVALDNELILGTASRKDDTIYTVFVHPEYHGRGIGTSLMHHVEQLARMSGYSSTKVPASVTSVGFYEQMGYQKVMEVRTEEAGLNIIMTKNL
jgi:GNAT superfamily N-acetyltransferase